MKRNFLYFCVALMAVCFVACGSEPEQEPEQPAMLTIQNTSIAEGAEVDAYITTELQISFNKMIARASGQVKVNDSVVTPDCSASTYALIPLSLRSGESYTVVVEKGAFCSKIDESVKSPAFTLHFTTKKQAGKDDIIKTLCNADAIPSAKKVYAYLLEQYGTSILSSTIANVSWNFAEAELVYKATGKYPAIATMDYIQMFTLTSHSPYHGSWKEPYNNTKDVEAWWQNNGLIAAGWHWNMPANEAAIDNTSGYTCTPGSGTTGQNATTMVTPTLVMTEGTWANKIAKEDLDKMVELLLLLQDKGIPVIWRPLHEASGNTYGQWAGGGAWFWWGIEGAEKYKALWRYMYDHFHNAGVNNLIWVWTSQNNGDTDWYPGDAYVDIIGQDIYNQGAASNAADFLKLQATYPKKMVTLSECGNVGQISDQWKQGARWSYFMPWYQYNATTLDGHQHANTAWWQDAMKQPYVISRDKLPSLK